VKEATGQDLNAVVRNYKGYEQIYNLSSKKRFSRSALLERPSIMIKCNAIDL